MEIAVQSSPTSDPFEDAIVDTSKEDCNASVLFSLGSQLDKPELQNTVSEFSIPIVPEYRGFSPPQVTEVDDVLPESERLQAMISLSNPACVSEVLPIGAVNVDSLDFQVQSYKNCLILEDSFTITEKE